MKFFLLFTIFAFFVSLNASIPAVIAAAAPEPLTFRARLSEDLGTLDWNYGEISPEIVYQLMEGLFRADDKGRPQPAVAERYKWNAEKTELVVHLKRDRRWSDGSPVCAQQFVDSWTRLQDKKFASPYKHFANNLKSYEAVSCRELRIKFERPSPEALARFSHYVFLPLRTDQLRDSPKAFTDGIGLIVNGPFQVASWKTNQVLALQRNSNYGGPAPALERVEFYFIPDENTAQVMYQQHRLDWVTDVPRLMRTPKMEKGPAFKVFPSLTSFYLGVHAGESDLLKDPAVKRALSEALDRREFPKILGREHRGVTAWTHPVLFPGLKSPVMGTHWEEAKKKLKEAVKAGKMDILLRVYTDPNHKIFAEWAQGQWEKKLGVRIPVEVQESKVYWREIYVSPAPIFLSGVTAPYGHPRSFLQEFLTTSTANWTGWSSTDYDKAVDEERFQDAENILHQSGVIIPLYTRDAVALVNPKWKGFFINPLGQVYLSRVGI